jgi:hypothetical protein
MVETNVNSIDTSQREEDFKIHKFWDTRKEYNFNKRFTAQKGAKCKGLFCLPRSDNEEA